jgi:hypothetical protein
MSSQAFESTSQLQFLTELVNSHTEVAGDILQIGLTTWAIYGSIPVDGDVLVAEYDSLESAKAALAQLPPNSVAGGQARRGELDAVDRSIVVPSRDRVSVSAYSNRSIGVPPYFLGRNSATWRAALAPRPGLARA